MYGWRQGKIMNIEINTENKEDNNTDRIWIELVDRKTGERLAYINAIREVFNVNKEANLGRMIYRFISEVNSLNLENRSVSVKVRGLGI